MPDFDPTLIYTTMTTPPEAPDAAAPAPAPSAPVISEDGATLAALYPSMRQEVLASEGITEAPPTEAAPTEQAQVTEEAPPEEAPPAPAIVAPEGLTVDPQAFEAFQKLATDAGVKPEVASAMLKMHADQLAAVEYERLDRSTRWAEEARADPDIGGARFEATVKSARAVLDTYGDKDLREALERSGLGNHKSVIRLLARVGEAIDYHRTLARK